MNTNQSLIKSARVVGIIFVLFSVSIFGNWSVLKAQAEQPKAVIALTKMNVFYLGVDNPIEIAVPGYQKPDYTVAGQNCRILDKGTYYVVHPKRPGNAVLYIVVGNDTIYSSEYRVKPVPDPAAKVCGKKSGVIPKDLMLAQIGVEASMENFDFDLHFSITEFTISALTNGVNQSHTSYSYKFTDQQKDLMRKLNRGDKLYVENIKAVGPDGNQRSLSAISLVIN